MEQINRSRDCQLEVFRALKDRLLPEVPRPKPEQVFSQPDKVRDENLLAELQENQLSDWVINGNNYNLVDSQLSSQGLFTAYVRNPKWNNYAVEFDFKQLTRTSYGFGVLIQRQSDIDYVALQLTTWWERDCSSRWVVARRGQETVLVNSEKQHTCAGHYRIEVDGNKYKLFKDGSEVFVFNNNTFANGGVGLKSRSCPGLGDEIRLER